MPRKVEDIAGQIFGSLKVLEYIEQRRYDYANTRVSISVWKCECLVCGNTREVRRDKLTVIRRRHDDSGGVMHCGCAEAQSAAYNANKQLFSGSYRGSDGVDRIITVRTYDMKRALIVMGRKLPKGATQARMALITEEA